MNPDKSGAGAKASASEGAGKQGLKGGPKGVPSALVPPNLTERQQLALLLKQTKTESVPAPSDSDSEVSNDSSDDDGSSSGADNRRKRKGGHSERETVKRQRGEGKQTNDNERSETDERRRGDEKKDEDGKKQLQDGGIRDGEGQSLDEIAPSAFGHSGRLPPPIPMPRGMGKRTRVRQRRTGAGDLRLHEGSGSGEDDDDPLPVRRPEEFASWPPAKQAAWNNLAVDPNAFYEKYAPPGHELDLGEWSPEEQIRFLQMLRDHPVENDQWGLFSMHFPSRNGMQCRQLHAKLVKSGVITPDGHIPSSSPAALEPFAANSSPGVPDVTPAKRDDSVRKEVQRGPDHEGDARVLSQKEAAPDQRPGVAARTTDHKEWRKLDAAGDRESTRRDPLGTEAVENQVPKKTEAGGRQLERRPSGEKENPGLDEGGRKPGEGEGGESKEKADRESVPTTEGQAETKGEERGAGLEQIGARDSNPGKEDALKAGHGTKAVVDAQQARDEVSRRNDVSNKDAVIEAAPQRVSRPAEGVRVLHLGGGAEGKGRGPSERGSEMPLVIVKPITAADMAARVRAEATGGGHRTHRDKNDRMAGVKIIRRNKDGPTSVTLVRRHLAPHLMAKAPAVALALPAIAKPVGAGPAATGKQMRMPNGKFGPSLHPKPKSSDEGGGPITLYRMVDGEKVSLTIREREGEEEEGEGKKRSHKGGGDSEGEPPKGLTVVLGGKTVHKRKRLSDPARAASPARERAKESEALGGLKRRESSDALFKAVKKVRIRHPASDADSRGAEGIPPERDDKQQKKRKRIGGEAPLRWAFATTPRLASNPSTPHSNAEGGQPNLEEEVGGLQPGGMSARVSSRELQQLLPASSPAYSPLLSLASSRKRERDVLNGPFRRSGGGFEDPQPPIHTRRLLAACKLLTVLDRREAKWHASISGGWKDGANGSLQDPPEAKEDPTRAVGGATEVGEEARRAPDGPPETGPDSMQIDNAPPEAEKAPVSADDPPETASILSREEPNPPETRMEASEVQENGAGGAEKAAGLEGPPGGGTEGDPLAEAGSGKVPEAILRRREELFAERVKLQKRWLYEYEILESSFERQYERALDDEPPTEEDKGAAVASTSNHALRSARGQPEGAHPFLRSADGASPAVPHQMSKSYVEVLFERCREDLLRRYQMEADTLDNWHRWLSENSGSLAVAARIALEQIPLDPRHVVDV